MEKKNLNTNRETNPSDDPQTNERGPNMYNYFLGISVEQLHGKVLNIGSGKTGVFEKILAKRGIDISTMSPYFANNGIGGEMMMKEYSKKPPFNSLRKTFNLPGYQKDIHTIPTGTEEGIPLKDDSVDYVLALYSVPLYLESIEHKEILISEIKRILNNSGEARIFPIRESEKDEIEKILVNHFLKFSFTEISEIGDIVYKGEKTFRLEMRK